ncbi:DUF305 domain-containing protein [Herbidospora galbida]|uniref:DUF305 domain-containing protein n=1 Tax=Herbidospora galbida TaxID=2575442 RepID=A0A4U3MQH3_9ACTN|nr:DUF305 domain-containing protein [Herbidospora galbida]TKK90547.1 DUF305 domain-containing protein [Herbidospora galbida]
MRRLLIVLLFACTACAGVQEEEAPVNAADVMFLQMMVAHNKQGHELARLAEGRELPQKVEQLAAAMRVTQETETSTMTTWLMRWEQPLTMDQEAHHAHGGTAIDARKDLARLRKTDDADFSRELLNALIAHQDDAIQFARYEKGSGANPGAIGLAEQIDVARSAQITYMLDLLDS